MPWFYASPDRRPLSAEDSAIAQLVASGVIRPDTLVWREGMAVWEPAAQVRPDWFQARIPGSSSPAAPPPPPYLAGPVAPPPSGLATASLVCGILAWTACWIVSGIPAVICGHLALSRIATAPSVYGGRGFAVAGLILGYSNLAVTIAGVVFVVLAGPAALLSLDPASP